MTDIMATTAQIIARRLYDAGCRHAFGMPGGEVLTMMDALAEAGLIFTLVKHENAGGFMAEGTWHATGAPGVLLATIGPGAANAVNVVANAQQDRVPLIFITGCLDAADDATYTHQIFDHQAVFAPITKASLRMAEGAVDELIDKALAIATDGQPGPVHIDLPIALAAAEQPDRTVARRNKLSPVMPAPGPDLDAARAMFQSAVRPVVVAGVDVLLQGAEQAVAEFCQAFKIPLITTYKAKGIVPEDDPLCLGGHGLSPLSDGEIMPLLEASDLVIAAGYDPIEMRIGWRDLWAADKVIEFCITPNTHYMHQAKLTFLCDVAAGLEALSHDIPARPLWPGGEPAATRDRLKAHFSPDETYGPSDVVHAVRRALPHNAVASADSGAHRILLSQTWECYEPRGLIQSTGLCTMGCGVPLAMGFKQANPDVPVVAFTGDAGIEMVLGELATARDLKLGVIIVVLVDRSLALIELKQRRSNLPNLGVDFGGTDFPAVANALGGTGVWAEGDQSIEQAVKEAVDREGFTLIACPIPDRAYDGRI